MMMEGGVLMVCDDKGSVQIVVCDDEGSVLMVVMMRGVF